MDDLADRGYPIAGLAQMAQKPPPAAAGFYRDPDPRAWQLRWWDGYRWTAHTRMIPGRPAMGRRRSFHVALILVCVAMAIAVLFLFAVAVYVSDSQRKATTRPATTGPAPTTTLPRFVVTNTPELVVIDQRTIRVSYAVRNDGSASAYVQCSVTAYDYADFPVGWDLMASKEPLGPGQSSNYGGWLRIESNAAKTVKRIQVENCQPTDSPG